MGNLCCTGNGGDVEDLISEIFSKTYLVNFEFYEVANKLKDYSFSNRLSKDDFDILVLSQLYSKDIRYSNYLDRIMEYIIPKDKEGMINIYGLLLAIYSFINNRKDGGNLYYIFENLCIKHSIIKTSELTVEDFKAIFGLYVNTVVCKLSQGVLKELENQKESDSNEVIEHMKLFTEDNCKKYVNKLLSTFSAKTIDQMKFEKFIADNTFIFNYKELRENFLEYIRFN
jgi:hypothetical protein